VLSSTGGLRVAGELPGGACVIVANHASHADTVALLAASPVRRRPVVAAAADYWFTRPGRAAVCRLLVGGFPVHRGVRGRGDLMAARTLLAAGRAVIVFPEGTRSRDGAVGAFHSGAAWLAREAGVPLVPVRIAGTHELMPVHQRVSQARSGSIGASVSATAWTVRPDSSRRERSSWRT
jgi:1-acyl-sn-glycerol-3-phosphate acyltransferase